MENIKDMSLRTLCQAHRKVEDQIVLHLESAGFPFAAENVRNFVTMQLAILEDTPRTCPSLTKVLSRLPAFRDLPAEAPESVPVSNPPPMRLKDAMVSIMGKKTMHIEQIVSALIEQNLMPKSQRPKAYVTVIASSNKNVFERVDRGMYRVCRGVKLTENFELEVPTHSPQKDVSPLIQANILEVLNTRTNASAHVIAQKINAPPMDVRDALRILQEKRKVKCTTGNKSTLWSAN